MIATIWTFITAHWLSIGDGAAVLAATGTALVTAGPAAVVAVLAKVPGWCWLVIVGALLIFLYGQHERVAGEQSVQAKWDVAKVAQAKIDATRAQEVLTLKATHAAAEKESEKRYETKLHALETARTADAADNQRLRRIIANYSAGGRQPGDSDAIAYQRAADRLKVIGALLEEGAGLLDEGLAVIGSRDAEIGRLLDQIQIDRAACTSARP
jgi:hypothetical protein